MEEERMNENAAAGKKEGLEKLSQPENCHIGHVVAVMSGKGGVLYLLY